jgi:amidase
MAELLPPGTVLAIPSTPGPAPFKNTPGDQLNAFREKAMRLTCIAGNAGLPQISIPLAEIDGCPLGLSLVGAPGTDMDLLLAAEAVWAAR